MSSNTVRIAKNTLMLYFRQILIMLVSLYTVRVILETLGAEDYGIYNVVAGIVTMFSFLSGSMATATQRYFAFELGRGDIEQLKKLFGLSLLVYLLIAAVVLILAETIGLWFVANKLALPLERRNPALWVYQFSIIIFIFTILTSPYMAMIIAYEDMNIYAYVSIAEVILKLGTVFVLRLIVWDKLILYGLLMLGVTLITTTIYRTICLKKYLECKFTFYWNKDLFREITSYTVWNMFGALVGIFKYQMVNVVLNQFFNPAVITVRSIAASVNSAVTSFSQNFNNAIRPPIIKSYASSHEKEMLTLMFRGAKGTYLLVYLFVLPLILEMPIVLGLWLKNPPEYTVLFTRLVLVDVLIDSISYPFMTAAQATGKIQIYQSVVGGILLLNLPVSWIILLMGYPPYSVMIAGIVITFVAFVARLLIIKRLINFSLKQLLRNVIAPLCVVSILSAVLPTVLFSVLDQNILQLCMVTMVSIFSICLSGYYICLNKRERINIKEMVGSIFCKEQHKNETC